MDEEIHKHHHHHEDSSSANRTKYAPTLTQLIKTAQKLPPIDEAQESAKFDAKVADDERHTITFDLIDIIDKSGEKIKKWTYKGRIIIESKYINSID